MDDLVKVGEPVDVFEECIDLVTDVEVVDVLLIFIVIVGDDVFFMDGVYLGDNVVDAVILIEFVFFSDRVDKPVFEDDAVRDGFAVDDFDTLGEMETLAEFVVVFDLIIVTVADELRLGEVVLEPDLVGEELPVDDLLILVETVNLLLKLELLDWLPLTDSEFDAVGVVVDLAEADVVFEAVIVLLDVILTLFVSLVIAVAVDVAELDKLSV